MFLTLPQLWLLFGIVLIILEFSLLTGIGFLFIGLGAVSNAVIISYLGQSSLFSQLGYFGIMSLLWFLLLWYPLKFFIYKKNLNNLSRHSFDIVGSQVKVVNNDIKNGDYGQVLWSGTIMNAKLLESTNGVAKVGEIIHVLEVQGNVLICTTNPPELL